MGRAKKVRLFAISIVCGKCVDDDDENDNDDHHHVVHFNLFRSFVHCFLWISFTALAILSIPLLLLQSPLAMRSNWIEAFTLSTWQALSSYLQFVCQWKSCQTLHFVYYQTFTFQLFHCAWSDTRNFHATWNTWALSWQDDDSATHDITTNGWAKMFINSIYTLNVPFLLLSVLTFSI